MTWIFVFHFQIKKAGSERFSLGNLFEKKDSSGEIFKPSSEEQKSSHRPSTTSTERITSTEDSKIIEGMRDHDDLFHTTPSASSAGQKILFTMSPYNPNSSTYNKPPRKKIERTRIGEKKISRTSSSVSYSSSSASNENESSNKKTNLSLNQNTERESSSSEEIFTNSHGVPPSVEHSSFSKTKNSNDQVAKSSSESKVNSTSTQEIRFSRPIKIGPSLAPTTSTIASTTVQKSSEEREPMDILSRIIKNLAPKWNPRTTTTTEKPAAQNVHFISKEVTSELPIKDDLQPTTYRPSVVHFESSLGGKRGGHPPIKIIQGPNLSNGNSNEETKPAPGFMDQFLDILVGSTQGGDNTLTTKKTDGGIVTSAIVPPWYAGSGSQENDSQNQRGPPMVRRRPIMSPNRSPFESSKRDHAHIPNRNGGYMSNHGNRIGPSNRPMVYGPPNYPQNSQEPYYIDSVSEQVSSADDAFHIKSPDGTTNIYGYYMGKDETVEQLGLESEPLTGAMLDKTMEITPTHTIDLTYENSGSPEIIIEEGDSTGSKVSSEQKREEMQTGSSTHSGQFIPTVDSGGGVRRPILNEDDYDLKVAETDHHQVVVDSPVENVSETQHSGGRNDLETPDPNEYDEYPQSGNESKNNDVKQGNKDDDLSYEYDDDWIPSKEKKQPDKSESADTKENETETTKEENVYTVYAERYGNSGEAKNVTSTTTEIPQELPSEDKGFVAPTLVDFHSPNKYTSIQKEVFHDRDGWRPLVRDDTAENEDKKDNTVEATVHTFKTIHKKPIFEKQYLHREENIPHQSSQQMRPNSQEGYNNNFMTVSQPIPPPIPASHKFPDSEEWNEDLRHRQRLQAQQAMGSHIQPLFHKGIIDRSKYMIRPAPPPIMMRRKPHRNMPFLSNIPPRRQFVPRIQRKSYESSVEYNVKKFPPRPGPERFKTLRARPRANLH